MEETKRRLKELTASMVAGGDGIEAAYNEAAAMIETGFSDIRATIDLNNKSISELQKKYAELGAAAAAAFTAAKDAQYNALLQQQNATILEIAALKKLVNELKEANKALIEHDKQLENQKAKVDKASSSNERFRTQLLNVKNEMMKLEQAGKKNTAEYARLVEEAKRLANAMYSANTQIKILTSTKGATLQGLVSGISGISGAFTAAQGAVGLFASKNEDLQKIMMKVQSLMSITMGLQAVSATIHQTSAFRVAVLTKVQAAYTTVVNATSKALTSLGISANVASVAAKGLTATLTFGLSVAIPVLIGLFSKLMSKQREAKKEMEEFHKSVAEISEKPVASVRQLYEEWIRLGDSVDEKQKFIVKSTKAFKEMGYAMKEAADIERFFNDPKSVDSFIAAQIAKAKAVASVKKSEKDINKLIEKEQKREQYTVGSIPYNSITKEVNQLNLKILNRYEAAAKYEAEGSKKLKELGIKGAEEYEKGTIGALEQAMAAEQAKLKDISSPEKYQAAKKNMADIQKQIDAITGGKEKSKSSKESDPFLKELEEKKKAYQEYHKWINSTDESVRSQAPTTFAELLKGGESYKAYLSNQITDLRQLQTQGTITAEQLENLRKLTTALQEDSGKTIMSEFEKGLKHELDSARTIQEMLEVLEKKRADLSQPIGGAADPLKDEKEKVLEKQQEEVVKKQQERTKQLISEYSDYLDAKINLENELTSDLKLLEEERKKATTEADRQAMDTVIKNRKNKYNEDKANFLKSQNEAKLKFIDLWKDDALLDISNETFTWNADKEKEKLEVQQKAAKKRLEVLQSIQDEAPTDETAAEIDKVQLELKELNADLEKMPNKKFQEMLSGFQKITGALGGLGGEVGAVFSGISSQVGNLQVAFDKTASKADKVSAAISGIVEVVNMVVSASEKRKEAEESFYRSQIALAQEYALALNKQLLVQSELSGSGFVTDYSGKIRDAFNAATDATSHYQEAMEALSSGKAKTGLRNAIDWGNVGTGAAAGAGAGAAIGSMIVPVIGTAVGAVIGGIVGGLTGLFGGKKKKETFGGLLEVFPELVTETGGINKNMAEVLLSTGQLDDNTKLLVQNALDWADAIDEANKQMKEVAESLAGDLGNSLKASLLDAFSTGENASRKMFDAASQSLEKFIEDILYSTIFSDIFAQFSDRLQKSLLPTGDQDVVDDYDWLMDMMDERDEVYLASLEAVKNRAAERGFDLWDFSKEPTTSLSGAIKGVNQESIDVLTGYMNNTMINQLDETELIRQQLIYLASIDAKAGISNKHLESIDGKLSATAPDPLRSQGATT
jgi:DNA repair exonuclease SbcCD ATPase subunit